MLTEELVRAYFVHLRDQKKQAPSSINIGVCALRFFFTHTSAARLARLRPTLGQQASEAPGRAQHYRGAQPPRCCSPSRAAYGAHHHLCLGAQAWRRPQARDRPHRQQAPHGVGPRWQGCQRSRRPPAASLLAQLRRYWQQDRPTSPTKYLFVSHDTQAPLHETTLQKTFTAARKEVPLNKHASIHTLRHSYGTHLLESDISLRTIQALLRHKSLRTTEVYMHVTQPGTERLQDVLDQLMANL